MNAQAGADLAPRLAPLDPTGSRNMRLLVHLRWIAAAGQVASIGAVLVVFGFDLPWRPMLLVVAALIGLNLLSLWRLRFERPVSNAELLGALVLDVAALTLQLFLSGGANNPFAFLYLLQVALGAAMLDLRATTALLFATIASFLGLTIANVPLPLLDMALGAHIRLQTLGLAVCFAINASLLVVFLTRVSGNIRRRDARLADLRQRAAEEDHIVRIGLLASGAAHELGTPLSTVSIILSDWRRMAAIRDTPGLMADVEAIEVELKRCKEIVSGILLSAGEMRGESAEAIALGPFLDRLAGDWAERRPELALDYRRDLPDDLSVIFDTTLRQAIHNVLDNAFEASPQAIALRVFEQDGSLVVETQDEGPGFDDAVLSALGRPYQTTKGAAGRGLGLFFAMNALRKLGGRLEAFNRVPRGAVVTLRLPLAPIMLRGEAGS